MSHKTVVLHVRFSPEQRKILEAKAKRCGVRLSVWIRLIALQCARIEARSSERGYLRIKEPNGDAL